MKRKQITWEIDDGSVSVQNMVNCLLSNIGTKEQWIADGGVQEGQRDDW
jgi:hypothetical protein